jgi:hypothetical protein
MGDSESGKGKQRVGKKVREAALILGQAPNAMWANAQMGKRGAFAKRYSKHANRDWQ